MAVEPRMSTPYIEVCVNGRNVLLAELNPGCRLEDIQSALYSAGAFYPPTPRSLRRRIYDRFIFRIHLRLQFR